MEDHCFFSDCVQALRRLAVRSYGKALDAGQGLPKAVGEPIIDMTLNFVVTHLEVVKSNLDILTSNVHNRHFQGIQTSGGDFVELGPDGELHIIPPEPQRPWLSHSPEDCKIFFGGLRIATTAPAPLAEETCAMCGATRGLQLCGGCKKVSYCSKEHQQAHWKEHKKTCRDSP